jgi:hypothetical protein
MSHVKNVQAFGKLTGICTGYGGQYNPGQQNLQVEALVALLNHAQQTLSEVNEAQTAYDNITNTRELGFEGVQKLSSRIFSVLKSCGAHALTIDDARVNMRRLRGSRSSKSLASTGAVTAEEDPKPGFSYSRDYASLAFYFAKLVETVSAEANYRPTEPELSVEGVQAKVAELQSLNDAVAKAEIELTSARRKRNALFYKGQGNLFATAVAAKQYVRGVFGFSSDQRVEVSKLRFTKPND